jgi:hypothetical protein
MRILAMIGGGFFGIIYSLLTAVILSNTPIFDARSYRGANDWGGLQFIANIPEAMLLFFGIFAWIVFAAKGRRSVMLGMVAGVVAATLIAIAFTQLFAPPRYSLPSRSSDLFILAWAILSFLLALLAKEIRRWSSIRSG